MWPLNLMYETSYIPSWNSVEEYYANFFLALFHINMAQASNIFSLHYLPLD